MRFLSINIVFVILSFLIPARVNGTSNSEGIGTKPPELLNYDEFVESIQYPEKCRKRGVQGKVLIRLRVNEKGRVEQYRIMEAPDDLIKRECAAHILNLRFIPALDEYGRAASAFIDLPIIFALTLK